MIGVKDWFYTWQLPIAAALVAALFSLDHWHYADQLIIGIVGPVRKELYSALATIFGALLGFVITAFSIVASFGENYAIQKLKARGDYKRVTRAFIRTTYTIAIATVVALAAIFMDGKPDVANRYWEYAVMFTAVWATLAVLGIIFVLETLVEAVNKSA